MISPFYEDDAVTLYCGDFRKIVPQLGLVPDLAVWGRWSLARCGDLVE